MLGISIVQAAVLVPSNKTWLQIYYIDRSKRCLSNVTFRIWISHQSASNMPWVWFEGKRDLNFKEALRHNHAVTVEQIYGLFSVFQPLLLSWRHPMRSHSTAPNIGKRSDWGQKGVKSSHEEGGVLRWDASLVCPGAPWAPAPSAQCSALAHRPSSL